MLYPTNEKFYKLQNSIYINLISQKFFFINQIKILTPISVYSFLKNFNLYYY